MSRLPCISGAVAVKALEKAGFRIRRQHGSHIILRRDHPYAQTVIPNHDPLDRGTLRAILRQCDIDVKEFLRLLG